ncbi:hypothetical protein LIER_34968 [Lithospermum erythrorhizon]|uniref:Formin-like protein 18 n=1 Tax=Lithospermum erythrorhizon TaxID=34254 RepID=A0AAV3NLV4_LITER
MDPCPFVRLTVTNLALKIPVAAPPTRSAVHPSSSPCFCKIKLKSFPLRTSLIPSNTAAAAATFHLSKTDIEKLTTKSIFTKKKLKLKIKIFTGLRGTNCGVRSGRLLDKVEVELDLKSAEWKPVVFHSGWVSVGPGGSSAQFHVNVKAEPDPRFVFEFDGEPECSPQVFQIQGSIRQPVFTCKFSFRAPVDRHQRSRSSEQSAARGWLSSFGSERERTGKERKGWSVTVHDLSGSPVAAASMVTPFVASPGSDRVSRSNPGSWLILRPGDGTWKPWGRLEAWRERGSTDGLGYRFELIPDSAATGIVLAESTMPCSKGGKFVIDLDTSINNSNWKNESNGGNVSSNGRTTPRSATSPGCSPRGSGDYGYGLWPYCMYRGFVMSASVEGEGANGSKCSKPMVEVSVQHVNCTEDAAAFVALSAAIDLSMDACRLFSHKLRKELLPPHDVLS